MRMKDQLLKLEMNTCKFIFQYVKIHVFFFQRPDPHELASDQLFQHILFCRKWKF